jgi:hypothetical protein
VTLAACALPHATAVKRPATRPAVNLLNRFMRCSRAGPPARG